MKCFSAILFILLFIGCAGESPEDKKASEFTRPEDGRIAQEQAESYVKASSNLMDAIGKHEQDIQEFIKRYHLKDDLFELSDSVYCEEHPEVTRTWNRLQKRWKNDELKCYKLAGINEEKFNWIGGALADTVNQDIQKWIQAELEKVAKE